MVRSDVYVEWDDLPSFVSLNVGLVVIKLDGRYQACQLLEKGKAYLQAATEEEVASSSVVT